MKATSTRAWDSQWEQTRHIHLLGTQAKPSQDAKVLQRVMGELSQMRLPIRAIDCIGYAVLMAYKCGRNGSMVNDEE